MLEHFTGASRATFFRSSLGTRILFICGVQAPAWGLGLKLCTRSVRLNTTFFRNMEADQGPGAASEEPRAESAAASDSFSQLWTDVMGMLVSFRGRGVRIIDWHHRLTSNWEFSPWPSKLTLICRMIDCVANWSVHANHASKQISAECL